MKIVSEAFKNIPKESEIKINKLVDAIEKERKNGKTKKDCTGFHCYL